MVAKHCGIALDRSVSSFQMVNCNLVDAAVRGVEAVVRERGGVGSRCSAILTRTPLAHVYRRLHSLSWRRNDQRAPSVWHWCGAAHSACAGGVEQLNFSLCSCYHDDVVACAIRPVAKRSCSRPSVHAWRSLQAVIALGCACVTCARCHICGHILVLLCTHLHSADLLAQCCACFRNSQGFGCCNHFLSVLS